MIAKILCLFSLVLLALGCGVKGDPLPPESTPELGRGRPTYKRATEDIIVIDVGEESEKGADEAKDDDEDEDDEDE